jgi:hypothetical protein
MPAAGIFQPVVQLRHSRIPFFNQPAVGGGQTSGEVIIEQFPFARLQAEQNFPIGEVSIFKSIGFGRFEFSQQVRPHRLF